MSSETNADLSATIKRLRKGKQEQWQAGKDYGYDAGEEWAKDTADYGSLAEVCEGTDLDCESFSELPECNNHDVHTFAQENGHEPDAFCEGYFVGFKEGAQSIWCQVIDEI